MIRRAWLYYLPLLFLPNLGASQATQFGSLELSDYLIGPYLILVFVAAKLGKPMLIDRVVRLMVLFAVWALVSTVLINFRFGYTDTYYMVFSLLKLAKFILYGVAGLLTIKAITDDRARRSIARSLLVAGIIAGISVALVNKATLKNPIAGLDPSAGYKASNGISVMVAVMACYLGGLWLQRKGMTRWTRRFVLIALSAMAAGSALSAGRGGWIAGLAGLIYISYRARLRREFIAIAIGAPLLLFVLYRTVPVFHQRVYFTFFAENRYGGTARSAIDDGARIDEWKHGIEQFGSPVWGTGFFHRGGESGLYTTGSHNFFLQMFLETGIVGGGLMLAIFCALWRQAGSLQARRARLDLPVKSALVAAIVGGSVGNTIMAASSYFLYSPCMQPAARFRRNFRLGRSC